MEERERNSWSSQRLWQSLAICRCWGDIQLWQPGTRPCTEGKHTLTRAVRGCHGGRDRVCDGDERVHGKLHTAPLQGYGPNYSPANLIKHRTYLFGESKKTTCDLIFSQLVRAVWLNNVRMLVGSEQFARWWQIADMSTCLSLFSEIWQRCTKLLFFVVFLP